MTSWNVLSAKLNKNCTALETFLSDVTLSMKGFWKWDLLLIPCRVETLMISPFFLTSAAVEHVGSVHCDRPYSAHAVPQSYPTDPYRCLSCEDL